MRKQEKPKRKRKKSRNQPIKREIRALVKGNQSRFNQKHGPNLDLLITSLPQNKNKNEKKRKKKNLSKNPRKKKSKGEI